ncbi:hypothetical protein Dimus_010658 [Dionaea muscipula]
MAESSFLAGHAVRRALNVDAAQRKNRKRIFGVKRGNNRLNQELTIIKKDFEISVDLPESVKADVDIVTQENQTLERKIKELQTKLKKETEERKRVDDEVVSLTSRLDGLRVTKMDLESSLDLKNRENEKMQTTLGAARLVFAQMKEKRNMIEARLSKQMEYATKEAIRNFMRSEQFKKMVSRLLGPVLLNGFKTRIAQVREMLEDDDELVVELEKMVLDPDVNFKKEPIPKIVDGESTVWSEEYEMDPMKFIKEWGPEMEGLFENPEPIVVVHPSGSTTEASQEHPTTEMKIPPPASVNVLPSTSDPLTTDKDVPPLPSEDTIVKSGEVL